MGAWRGNGRISGDGTAGGGGGGGCLGTCIGPEGPPYLTAPEGGRRDGARAQGSLMALPPHRRCFCAGGL